MKLPIVITEIKVHNFLFAHVAKKFLTLCRLRGFEQISNYRTGRFYPEAFISRVQLTLEREQP